MIIYPPLPPESYEERFELIRKFRDIIDDYANRLLTDEKFENADKIKLIMLYAQTIELMPLKIGIYLMTRDICDVCTAWLELPRILKEDGFKND